MAGEWGGEEREGTLSSSLSYLALFAFACLLIFFLMFGVLNFALFDQAMT